MPAPASRSVGPSEARRPAVRSLASPMPSPRRGEPRCRARAAPAGPSARSAMNHGRAATRTGGVRSRGASRPRAQRGRRVRRSSDRCVAIPPRRRPCKRGPDGTRQQTGAGYRRGVDAPTTNDGSVPGPSSSRCARGAGPAVGERAERLGRPLHRRRPPAGQRPRPGRRRRVGTRRVPAAGELVVEQRERTAPVRRRRCSDAARHAVGSTPTETTTARASSGTSSERVAARDAAERAELVTADQDQPARDAPLREPARRPPARVGLVGEPDLDVLARRS